MTADPKRWREEEGQAISAFIDALRADEPSADAREALWAKIAPALPPGGGGTPSGGGGGALRAKAIAMGVAVIGIVTVVAWITTGRTPVVEAPPPAASSTSIASPPPVESVAVPVMSSVEAAEPPAPSLRPQPRQQASAAARPAPSSSVDRLREEAEGVRRARQLLRDKNPGAALAELDRLAKLVPGGPLAEEREVLTIEAIAASGDREGARRRAERFLFERPNSVHASRVRAFTER